VIRNVFYILIGATALFAVVFSFAWKPSAPAPSRNPIVFAAPIYSFGDVSDEATPAPLQLEIRNTFSHPVEIAAVHVGCGCLRVATPVPFTLASGQTGTVIIAMDALKLSRGKQQYVVSLMDGVNRVVGQVPVTYSYTPFFIPQTPQVRLDRNAKRQQYEGTAYFAMRESVTTGLDVSTSIPDASLSYEIIHSNEGNILKVELSTPTTSQLTPSDKDHSLTVRCELPDQRTASAQAALIVPDALLSAFPSAISFGNVSESTIVTRTVRIESDGDITTWYNLNDSEDDLITIKSGDPAATPSGTLVTTLEVTFHSNSTGLRSGSINVRSKSSSLSIPFSALVLRGE
jgi:Protein of unknown function (DUF1573)